jgi:two-component system, chemotaxis family, protein-glutamate methylesterase/glutaminase
MSLQQKVRVLVVDDSAIVRRAISQVLSQDPDIEVVGTACDPYVARDKILELNPDIITLDIEMPRMDGLTFLRILQQHHPMPVVIISSLSVAGSQIALQALEAGAVDVLAKPSSAWSLGDLHDQLPARIKGAARARLKNLRFAQPPSAPQAVLTRNVNAVLSPRQLIVIGASTGGTEALKSVLTRLPDGLPGICIVQHIPPVFSRAFADRLNECCAFEVREAAQGDEVKPGLALIAPGDYHMTLRFETGRYRVYLNQDPPRHHTRPSVDVLFESVAPCAGPHMVSVILTGMGSDGALGMQQLKARGAHTIAQDEASCVVYGMPRAAKELGVVDEQVSLERVPQAILNALHPHSDPAARASSPEIRHLAPHPLDAVKPGQSLSQSTS